MNCKDFEREEDLSNDLRTRLDGFAAANDVELGRSRIELNGRVRERSSVTLRQCREAAEEAAGEFRWTPGVLGAGAPPLVGRPLPTLPEARRPIQS